MKSKKLIAILTLVVFMMTLVPALAFGYSAAASTVKATNTSLDVYSDTDDLAKVTVTFKTGGAAVAEGTEVTFYVKSDRDAELGYVDAFDGEQPLYGNNAENANNMSKSTGQAITAETFANGTVVLYVGSTVKGNFKISVYNEDNAEDGLLIGSVNITVSVGTGNITLIGKNETRNTAVTMVEGATVYTTKAGDGVELTATVEDGGFALEGKTVSFQAKYEGGSFVTIATDVTDEDGEAKYYFEQTKTGAYEYRAKYDDETTDGTIKITVRPHELKTIELKTADGKKIAKDKSNILEFYVKDKYGNLIKNEEYITDEVEDNMLFTIVSAPAGSKFEDAENVSSMSGASFVYDKLSSDGYVKLDFTPDKEGDYAIKVKQKDLSRISATINVTAVKFGDATSLKFKLLNTEGKEVTQLTRVYKTEDNGTETNKKAGEIEVYLVNAAGVELKTTSGLRFASSDVGKIDFTNTEVGNVRVKKDAIGTYTVTVFYDEDNLVGTLPVQVVGTPNKLVVTPAVNGKSAAVTMQYVDSAGNKTWPVTWDEDAGKGVITEEEYRIILPSGLASSNVKKIDKTGKATFDLAATEYGTYNVTVITNTKGITTTFPVEFVMPASEKPVIGAKSVTMFIGATGFVQDGVAKVTDVAPFIKDGRTFVAVRPIADAFGAAIGWNEATQTVTLTRSDVTVTIVIGSPTITVVKDGVTTTVTADVAAFIKDGRTVLPFRAVGDAFGATVSYDAATQAVSYQQ